ncbi:MAG: AAA family ATPase [Desulfobacteraceae bacterium]|nr:AAA family ATPase [Desulfobacteraceae bacterium]
MFSTNEIMTELRHVLPPINERLEGLKRKSRTESCCPCPFCGGDDRFTVFNDKGNDRAYCRHCGSVDRIDFHMRLNGLDRPIELAKKILPHLFDGSAPKPTSQPKSRQLPAKQKEVEIPDFSSFYKSLHGYNNAFIRITALLVEDRRINLDLVKDQFNRGNLSYCKHEGLPSVVVPYKSFDGKIPAVQFLSITGEAYPSSIKRGKSTNKPFKGGSKPSQSCFFLVGQAIENAKEIIIHEAVINALSGADAYPAACHIALGSTSFFRKLQALKTKAKNVERFTICQDNDPAGDKLVENAQTILSEQVHYVAWSDDDPKGYDLNDLAQAGRKKSIIELIKNAVSVVIDVVEDNHMNVAQKEQLQGFFDQDPINLFDFLEAETEPDRIICSFSNGAGGIPYGEVTIFAGEGGTGKTQYLRQVLGSVAFGHDLTGGGLTINETGQVLMVSGEDDENSTKKFAKMTGKYFHNNGLEIPEENWGNLQAFTRRRDKGLKPPRLVKLGKKQTVEATKAFAALKERVKYLRPLLLVLDSYSIMIGIGENSNEIAGSALGLIGTLQKYCGAIIIIAHTSQAATVGKLGKSKLKEALEYALSESAIRGVGAIKDNVRWACLATRVPRKFNRTEFGLEEDQQVIAVAVPKTNLTASQLNPVFFIHEIYNWRNRDGSRNSGMLLKYIDPSEFQTDNKALQEDMDSNRIIESVIAASKIGPVKKVLFVRGGNLEWESKYGKIPRPQNRNMRTKMVSDLITSGKLSERMDGQEIYLEIVKNKAVSDAE